MRLLPQLLLRALGDSLAVLIGLCTSCPSKSIQSALTDLSDTLWNRILAESLDLRDLSRTRKNSGLELGTQILTGSSSDSPRRRYCCCSLQSLRCNIAHSFPIAYAADQRWMTDMCYRYVHRRTPKPFQRSYHLVCKAYTTLKV